MTKVTDFIKAMELLKQIERLNADEIEFIMQYLIDKHRKQYKTIREGWLCK